MIRMVIENILLFIAPTALYVAYVLLVRKDDASGKDVLADAPLLWLCVAGAGLVMLVMVAFGSMSGGAPSQGYEPPVFKDGKIVPGHRQ